MSERAKQLEEKLEKVSEKITEAKKSTLFHTVHTGQPTLEILQELLELNKEIAKIVLQHDERLSRVTFRTD